MDVIRQAEVRMGHPSFEDLYRSEVVALTALATSMTGNREAARDLVHEAMLRAYRDWSRVGSFERPGAWVRHVLINLSNDWLRRSGRERRALRRLPADATVELADPVSERFWAAVRALPDRQRATLTLFYVEDLSVAEIARILDVSEGTIKTTLFKGRRTLARTLHAEEDQT